MSTLYYIETYSHMFGRKKIERLIWQAQDEIRREQKKFNKDNRLIRKLLGQREPNKNSLIHQRKILKILNDL